jgi:predicted AlkP superfamily phosphohydrolase/phosphomutase
VDRVIILGLDGMDPRRLDRLMKEGRLPNFSKLADTGMYSRIESTIPPISPCAWSSFMTGSNPGKHNIFDFLNRDLQTYLPELSSSSIRTDSKGNAVIKLLRKSIPFWHILGEHGVFSTVLRVPITFPPEKFRGLSLAGMCVPDMRGSQGTFTCFAEESSDVFEGGEIIVVKFSDHIADCELPGPPNPKDGSALLKVPVHIDRNPKKGDAEVTIGKERVTLELGEYSDWVRVSFKMGAIAQAHSIARLMLVSKAPFRLYITPLNIDPENPALPISHPNFYSIYLSKLHGSYATLGLAEDTWAHTEGVINDTGFLDQAYDIDKEREKMFFGALDRTRKGLCTVVFDTPDRIQHMFMRPRDAKPGTMVDPTAPNEVLDDMYQRMDKIVGQTLAKTRKKDVLIVMSDHGFSTFDRGVNLNTWLEREGLLFRKDEAKHSRYLQGIEWSKSPAYVFGLAGMYLNIKGREGKGIVEKKDAAQLKAEITKKLLDLVDPVTGKKAIYAVHDSSVCYTGPFANSGPDLLVGFAEGYRASWRAAAGEVEDEIFSDNTKSWSGDHCVDRAQVPGIVLCNRKLNVEQGIGLIDIAPTVLDFFGVPVPKHMDGRICTTPTEVPT